jgi:hypothetical protein
LVQLHAFDGHHSSFAGIASALDLAKGGDSAVSLVLHGVGRPRPNVRNQRPQEYVGVKKGAMPPWEPNGGCCSARVKVLLRFASEVVLPVGTEVDIEFEGQWLTARVTGYTTDGGQHCVPYDAADGFKAKADVEWVRLTHANERSGLSAAAASGDGVLWRRSAVSVGPALAVE